MAFGLMASIAVTAGLMAVSADASSAAPMNIFVSSGTAVQTRGACIHPNYNTIQGAIDAAGSGAVIHVCGGTYVEQLTITKNLRIVGFGASMTSIVAPAVLTADGDGKYNVVEIGSLTSGSPVTVSIKKLTVSGPGPGPCGTIDSGIAVVGGSMLNIKLSTVGDIRDNPIGGCQNGEGIRAGTQRYVTNRPEVGHVVSVHTTVSHYQKNGIVVSGAGSTGVIRHDTISTTNPGIGSNGIEATSGGRVNAALNVIFGNECDVPTVCGSDFTTQAQGTGILLVGPGSPTVLARNTIHDNDEGIYTDTGITMTHNVVSSNRYEGIFVDSGASGVSAMDNVTSSDGFYGVYLGSTTGSTAGEQVNFIHQTAQGNATDDLFWDGNGTLNGSHNICTTAAPSTQAWHC
jgi:parallel beta-helix repeat protein